MQVRLEQHFPPYMGDEPYLFFCFADADAARIEPLLRRLYARGCRIWYCTGRSSDIRERESREARMRDASLTVLYLTAAAREDLETKSAILSCQARQQPILSLDTDEGDSELSMGLTEHVRHIRLPKRASAEDAEAMLIRAEGFSQELIGEAQTAASLPRRRLAAGMTALAAVILTVTLLGRFVFGWFGPSYHDTVQFSDAVMTRAVRTAAGGGDLTEETLSQVRTLRLTELPSEPGDLSLLPALERVELPQELAEQALWLLEDGYTVVLLGGETP